MKHTYRILLSTAALAITLSGCQSLETGSGLEASEETKMVVDELDREVEIPEEIDRVVMGSILPYFSTWFIATNSTEEIAGIHPNSFNAASHSILKDISPAILEAKTNFIKNGEVNVEELAALNPDVYFEIANQEKTVRKLEDTGINTVALDTTTTSLNPLDTLNRWLALTGDITGVTDCPEEIIAQGQASQEMIDETLAEAKIKEEEKPRVMVLQYHNDGEISVAGQNMHGNRWLHSTGGADVAEAEIEGIKAVNMEQIYSWNPDIIYITNFTETQPEDLYNNVFEGQDWSQIKAVKDKKVYKMPLGIYRWYPPSGDAPLMLKWMAQKNHPDLFTYDINHEIKDYYERFYDYELTDEQVEEILHPSSEAAKY
ncbi:ABC transporter substrate-binding protein [Oceanobacillus massiliensis]|uniref:ABC transporter substrate-binding protein n=1 Tax=Oceanobacillus massiliensis TaxID=1465765 RepID=UPI000287E881|nr:ABC transporter substrate-binding protein [Oceanobacillus massiliensis]